MIKEFLDWMWRLDEESEDMLETGEAANCLWKLEECGDMLMEIEDGSKKVETERKDAMSEKLKDEVPGFAVAGMSYRDTEEVELRHEPDSVEFAVEGDFKVGDVGWIVPSPDALKFTIEGDSEVGGITATDTPVGKKYDQGKPMMSLIPAKAELEVAKVLTFGAEKYGADNWKHVENAKQRYTDAFLRHTNSIRQGEVVDPETGLSHYAHAVCCLLFLLEMHCDEQE